MHHCRVNNDAHRCNTAIQLWRQSPHMRVWNTIHGRYRHCHCLHGTLHQESIGIILSSESDVSHWSILHQSLRAIISVCQGHSWQIFLTDIYLISVRNNPDMAPQAITPNLIDNSYYSLYNRLFICSVEICLDVICNQLLYVWLFLWRGVVLVCDGGLWLPTKVPVRSVFPPRPPQVRQGVEAAVLSIGGAMILGAAVCALLESGEEKRRTRRYWPDLLIWRCVINPTDF